jgi:RNA-directed DNA polymerase
VASQPGRQKVKVDDSAWAIDYQNELGDSQNLCQKRGLQPAGPSPAARCDPLLTLTTRFNYSTMTQSAGLSQDDAEGWHLAAFPVSPGLPRGSELLTTGRRATVHAAGASPVALYETGWGPRRSLMATNHFIARNLAAAFLSGTWSPRALVARGAKAFGGRQRWLPSLVRRIFAACAAPPPWEPLAAFIAGDAGFDKAWGRHHAEERWGLHRIFWVKPTMTPSPGQPSSWPVPALTTSTALADWLGLTHAELDWFADRHGYEADVPPGPLRHYTYRFLPKPSGKWRLLEAPKPRLKALQRRLLHDLLDRIPPHDTVHGYRHGRSIATFAAPHCGRRIVLRFDLRHFFPSVRSSRIHTLFRTAGYPREVARLLTGLCTNVVPDDVWRTIPGEERVRMPWDEQKRFRCPHLPQGAPTSPALANLCAYRLDCRLQGLARSLGAGYTRYADDLAFSGGVELEKGVRRFQVHVCRIALEEGFEIHTRKSRFMRQGVRQQLVGIVVNDHPNLRRAEYDNLKAILHNCSKHGPHSQNRANHADFQAHLQGRVAHAAMLNAHRGGRLRALFESIAWDQGPPGP